MIRTMIVDDEELSLKRVKRLLTECGEAEVCGAFQNPVEALAYAEENHIDAAFLDISMPLVSGIKLVGKLREIQPAIAIVLVTGFDEYAVKAYDMDVLDYVIKPITADRLSRTLVRIHKHREYIQAGTSAEPPSRAEDTPGSAFSLRLFGGVEMTGGQSQASPIKFRSPKTEELLAFLVCKKSVSREEVADTLWRDLSQDKALKNLNSTLYYIRRALGSSDAASLLVTDRNILRIDAAGLDCDLYQFEKLLQHMRQSQAPDATLFQELDALFAGEFLKGRSYDWASDLSRRLEQDYLEIMGAAARYHAKSGDSQRALHYYERMLQIDELREDVHREVISLYVGQGRSAEAHRQFRHLERLLQRELGSTPDPRISRLLDGKA
ncbi:response regulator [Paenibacillus sp. CAU 1782]